MRVDTYTSTCYRNTDIRNANNICSVNFSEKLNSKTQ